MSTKRSTIDFNSRLANLFNHFKHDLVASKYLMKIERFKHEFLAFQGFKSAPVTTNLIECFNSHLEGRLKSLHHFHSFQHAQLWLNGYVLKRRFSKFVNCKGKFKKFNGQIPLNQSKNPRVDLPTFF